MGAARHSVFATVRVVALCAVAATVAAGCTREPQPPKADPPLVQRQADMKQADRHPDGRRWRPPPHREDRALLTAGERRETRARRQVAERFLAALLRLEQRRAPPGVRATIASLSEPQLARALLAEPLRVPVGVERPPAGQAVALEQGAASPHVAWVTATIERGGRRTGLVLELRRRGGRWLVSDLR
jgi:hypothetical protein